MKVNPEALKFFLGRLIPRTPVHIVAQRAGIDPQKLERALREGESFSYEELSRLAKVLNVAPPLLIAESFESVHRQSISRFTFRMLARTRREKKVVWWDVLPESEGCGVIYAQHTGLKYLKDPISPVLQCTGLTDRRGVPVYEGDIVEIVTETGKKYAGVITWLPEYTGFSFETLESHIPILEVRHLIPKGKVIGNKYIAPLELYYELIHFGWCEIDERTGLRTVIRTGRPRPDGDDIVLYLERDFDKEESYLTDLGETEMYLATLGINASIGELKVSVDKETILLNLKGLIDEIEGIFMDVQG